MSSGVVHKKASIILSGGIMVVSLFMLDLSNLLYIVGALIGIFVTPDWDVDAGFEADKIIRTKIGKWAETIWDGFLYWYRRSLKHGSPLSHFPIVGTIGRILYTYMFLIFIPHVVFYLIFRPEWDLIKILIGWLWEIAYQWKIVMGLMMSDFVHWGLDILTTEHKKKESK